MCSQVKKSLKSASLGVKIAVEVDMIEIESKLRAHWEQISKNQAIFSELLWLFHKAENDGDYGSPVYEVNLL